MKTLTIYLFFSVFAILKAFSQIGINTENPRQLFHLDGASSPATTNPSTGSVSASQASDDVVIDSSGNMGIGTTSPTAKLHIEGKYLVIQDGSQGERKILMSDEWGFTSWNSIPTWSGSLLNGSLAATQTPGIRQVTNFLACTFSSTENGASVDIVNGKITVPHTGYYKIKVSAFFENSFTAYPVGKLFAAHPAVYVNGVVKYSPNVVSVAHTYGVSPTFVTLFKLNAGDVITLHNNEYLWASNQIIKAMLFVELLQ